MLTHKELFTADDEGRTLVRPFVKNPSVVTVSGIAFDLTFFGRYPPAEYMTDGAPNEATVLRRSVNGGLDHGEDKGAGYRKYLSGLTVMTVTAGAVPASFMVMDYLLYYPLIAMEDIQLMDNTATLTRHTDGRGVQIMLVEQFPYVGGGTCQITYTNSDGVAGRVTPIMTINTQTTLGTIATNAQASSGATGIFVPLQYNDAGVRSIESIQFFTADAGNLAAVLVYPLCPFGVYDNTCPSEWDTWRDLGILSPIEDENNRDAYLSLVCRPNGSMSGAILDGSIKTMWIEV